MLARPMMSPAGTICILPDQIGQQEDPEEEIRYVHTASKGL